MKDFSLPDTSLVSFDFFDNISDVRHAHTNIEIFYVIDGEVEFILENINYSLKPNGFLIVNSSAEHCHNADKNCKYACVYINYHKLCRRINLKSVSFMTNPQIQKPEEANELRNILKQIFHRYPVMDDQMLNLGLESLYYKLLDILVTCFMEKKLINSKNMSDEQRQNIILDYINNNYWHKITLKDLSDILFLSTTYISRYFKEKFNTNFYYYLNSVRLSHAVDDMKNTNKSLTYIALDNGFPNVAAFTQVFKQEYKMNPSMYMKKVRGEVGKKIKEKNEEKKEKFEKATRLIDLPNEYGMADAEEKVLVHADMNKGAPYHKSWNQMVNVGCIKDMLHVDMQEHLLTLKKELGFKYVRFWDLYAPEMMLNLSGGKGNYNFARLDRVFDFLIENNIYPFIEIGFKPLQKFDQGLRYIFRKERGKVFNTPEEYGNFIYAFMAHYANRYGSEEIENWIIEKWKDRKYHDEEYYKSYFNYFEQAYSAVKKISPVTKVGGAGLSTDELGYAEFIHHWYNRPVHPDFFTMECYPYMRSDGTYQSIKDGLNEIKGHLKDAGFTEPEIYICEWNLTVSDRNILNDSVFKGAFIIQNILTVMDQVKIMGYWLATDLASEYDDSNKFLCGSTGLITRNGIKKPGYFAFLFLNQMGRYLVKKFDYGIITQNGHGDYYILCHNYKALNVKYSLKYENELNIDEQAELYVDNKSINIFFKLCNLEDGRYRIENHSVNERSGSVQHEWMKMGQINDLKKEEIEYLKRICTPHMMISHNETINGKLEFEITLEPQEIRFIHIIREIAF